MKSTDAINKNGRSFTRTLKFLPLLAANKNGKRGKQQLDARTTLPNAARLATTVRFDRAPFSVSSFVLRSTRPPLSGFPLCSIPTLRRNLSSH